MLCLSGINKIKDFTLPFYIIAFKKTGMQQLSENSSVVPSKKLRIIMTGQCNARCGYCHNEGVPVNEESMITADYVRNLLKAENF